MPFVTVDTTELPPYTGLGGNESPPPKPRAQLEPHKALLHGILSGQHPGLGHPAATAHALMTAHRTNVYTTSNTGECKFLPGASAKIQTGSSTGSNKNQIPPAIFKCRIIIIRRKKSPERVCPSSVRRYPVLNRRQIVYDIILLFGVGKKFYLPLRDDHWSVLMTGVGVRFRNRICEKEGVAPHRMGYGIIILWSFFFLCKQIWIIIPTVIRR